MAQMTKTMRAVEIERPGGPEVLKPAERPLPVPKAHEVLVKVAAAGVNRPDVLQRSGHYRVPPDASDLPGLEVAGEVVARGDAVTMWKPGDKVAFDDELDALRLRAHIGETTASWFRRGGFDLPCVEGLTC